MGRTVWAGQVAVNPRVPVAEFGLLTLSEPLVGNMYVYILPGAFPLY